MCRARPPQARNDPKCIVLSPAGMPFSAGALANFLVLVARQRLGALLNAVSTAPLARGLGQAAVYGFGLDSCAPAMRPRASEILQGTTIDEPDIGLHHCI